jgi:hypothetical protein
MICTGKGGVATRATVVTGVAGLTEDMMEDMLIKIMIIVEDTEADGEIIMTVEIGAEGQVMDETVETGAANQTKAVIITRGTGVVVSQITEARIVATTTGADKIMATTTTAVASQAETRIMAIGAAVKVLPATVAALVYANKVYKLNPNI